MLQRSEQVYELYFKTMSTGQDHPRADVPSIRSFNKTPSTGVNPSDVNSAVRVQVAGELVALLIKDASESLGGHLEIWNYTRSELSVRLTLHFPPESQPTTILDVVFSEFERRHRRFQLPLRRHLHSRNTHRAYRAMALSRSFNSFTDSFPKGQIRITHSGRWIHILVSLNERKPHYRPCPHQRPALLQQTVVPPLP